MRGPFEHPGRLPGVLDQNQQDYATQVTAALNLQGRSPAHVDPKVQVGITLDDFTRPEFWHLRQGTSWSCFDSSPAVAAQRSGLQLSLAALRPGTLVVIERIRVVNLNAATSAFNYGWKQIEAAVGATPATRDLRLGGVALPSATLGRYSFAAPAPIRAGGFAMLPANQMAVIDLGWVFVTPGNVGAGEAFGIINQAVNESLTATVEWRERPALPTEF